jgi:Holliday junction DNA helicase RuvB
MNARHDDNSEDRLVGALQSRDEREIDHALRPKRFAEFVGQRKIMGNLHVYVAAAKQRKEPLDHVLLCGPPGLGKTTVAHILANELGTNLATAHGPAIEHKGQLAALLTRMERGDVLFIDEIHRLSPVIEENLYTAVEDFRIDIVQGDGPYAATLQLPINPFTLIGATTRTGLLTNPMLSRFGIVERLDYYPAEDLAEVVRRSARLLQIELQDDAALELARRARGTPRIANRLLRRARDYAQVMADGVITTGIAEEALAREEVDAIGLDAMDRKVLRALIEKFPDRPVGLDTLAASVAEEADTLADVIEPYLLQLGFIQRTPRGRIATRLAYDHLGIAYPERPAGGPPQLGLWPE